MEFGLTWAKLDEMAYVTQAETARFTHLWVTDSGSSARMPSSSWPSRTEGKPVFHEARAPTRDELQGLLGRIIARLLKVLTRSGDLVEEQGVTYMADIDPDNPLMPGSAFTRCSPRMRSCALRSCRRRCARRANPRTSTRMAKRRG